MVFTQPLLPRPYTIQAGRVGVDLVAASATSLHPLVKRLAVAADLVEQQASRSFLWSRTSALITEMSSGAQPQVEPIAMVMVTISTSWQRMRFLEITQS